MIEIALGVILGLFGFGIIAGWLADRGIDIEDVLFAIGLPIVGAAIAIFAIIIKTGG